MKDGSNIIQGPGESSEKDTEVKKKIEDDMDDEMVRIHTIENDDAG